MEKWITISSAKVIDNKWITIEKQKCVLENGKVIPDFYVVKKKDYVIIVAESQGEILFLKQYRQGIGQVVFNLPMGYIEAKEKRSNAARRELLEETGYHAQRLYYAGEFYMAPSYCSSKAHVFYTNALRRKMKKKDVFEGKTKIIRVAKGEINSLLQNDMIKDMSTLTALLMIKAKLNVF